MSQSSQPGDRESDDYADGCVAITDRPTTKPAPLSAPISVPVNVWLTDDVYEITSWLAERCLVRVRRATPLPREGLTSGDGTTTLQLRSSRPGRCGHGGWLARAPVGGGPVGDGKRPGIRDQW